MYILTLEGWELVGNKIFQISNYYVLSFIWIVELDVWPISKESVHVLHESFSETKHVSKEIKNTVLYNYKLLCTANRNWHGYLVAFQF